MKNRLIISLGVFTIILATWTNLTVTKQLAQEPRQEDANSFGINPVSFTEDQYQVTTQLHTNSSTLEQTKDNVASSGTKPESKKQPAINPQNTTTITVPKSKILGFADSAYTEYAIRWYHRLTDLGYSEHVIVAVDQNATNYFQKHHPDLRVEELPYKPCVSPLKDSRMYRRQIFGRRWKYVHEQLKEGFSVLLTDVDNVYFSYVPMDDFQQSNHDVIHAYSTSYPTYVFEELGFTVCGGMSWLRSTSSVIRFVGTLVNRCHCLKEEGGNLCKKCYCDDQVVLNEMLWKGKHSVTWDRKIDKPASLSDYQWTGMTGVSQTTKHRVAIWDRSFAYRAPLPKTCPDNNWVAMPLYVDRDVVVDVWDSLCANQTRKKKVP